MTALKTLHASSERATGSVNPASALGSSDPSPSRHPNLHHRRTQNRQLLNVQLTVQLDFIKRFIDLPRESRKEEVEEEGSQDSQ